MNLVISSGPKAECFVEPESGQPLNGTLLDALITARTFLGRHTQLDAALQFVHLVGGKLYASDNRCLIQIDLFDSELGPGRFSVADIAVLKAMKEEPTHAAFGQDVSSLHWDMGRWCLLPFSNANTEFVQRCQRLLDRFWHEGKDAKPAALVVKNAIAKLQLKEVAKRECLSDEGKKKFKRAEIVKFRVDGLKQQWHIRTIQKVMAVAETYDPNVSLVPFTFPNGRGLMVKPSEGNAR